MHERPLTLSLAEAAYRAARPMLFALDPERAHHVALRALASTAALWRTCLPRVDDPVTLFGVRFPNRVGLAAGLDKDGRHIDALAALGFGFVEIGTVTPRPQPGNPRPRLFRLAERQALINRFGFNNDGLEAFVARVRASRPGVPLGLNIGKNASTPIEQALDDYETGLRGVAPHADYVTVNVSSPNTRDLRSLQGGQALLDLLDGLVRCRREIAAAGGRHVPLLVKIAPDLDDDGLQTLCEVLPARGIDGIIATNTTLDRSGVAGVRHADEAGGLSGAPLTGRSQAVVERLRARLPAGFPIIGVGGIMNADDARRRLAAGADLIQLYTGLIYGGPALVNACARAARAARSTTAPA